MFAWISCVLLLLCKFGFVTSKGPWGNCMTCEPNENIPCSNLTKAIRDIVAGLPATHVTVMFDASLGLECTEWLARGLQKVDIAMTIFKIDQEKNQDVFLKFTLEAKKKHKYSANLIFANEIVARNLLCKIQEQDLIHRKILHMVYWGPEPIDLTFAHVFAEAMRIAIISNPRPGIYRVYYNQAEPSGENNLRLVNWWAHESGLFKNPVLPASTIVYNDFHGRVFQIPVLHKPPWHFVIYNNDTTISVDGGRDDKLMKVIAVKLNFRYEYIDPPERNQGSSFNKNGSFPGVLGLIWRREADFFIGDVTINLERSTAVEFSFLTLVDSEVFVTHRPSKLNEALALVRPFHWQVWPLVVTLILLSGPALFFIIEVPSLWRPQPRVARKRRKLFSDCVWFSTATFLKQGGKHPGRNHKTRLVMILMSLGSTYVIGDMYSANLTSLLARPGRENPITTLEQLENAMRNRGYQLLTEKHSSSFTTLQNGTGIYKRLWGMMQQQRQSVIDSVEAGMKMVRGKMNVAVLGGRETLYFDTKRFGSYNFHLSEKLNTRYSAIAMQNGSPYIENMNKILMLLFEGGILTKMTEEEYEILGEKLRAAAGVGQTDEDIAEAKKETATSGEQSDPQGGSENVQEGASDGKQPAVDTEHQLQPLNTRMLQGAFYILVIGYLLSGGVLALEWEHFRYSKKAKKTQRVATAKRARLCRRRCLNIRKGLARIEKDTSQWLNELFG